MEIEVLEWFFSSFIGIIAFIISLAVYFLPTIIAAVRKKRNILAIFLLNLFLGWTFIGWVVALVWAVTKN
ncbi:MAG: superinfection immunity protein [Dehalococcoidales bacterium]|jgi:hypothetical protein|nr:superinfection immunity protein [Dehalococcoidales bacterium]